LSFIRSFFCETFTLEIPYIAFEFSFIHYFFKLLPFELWNCIVPTSSPMLRRCSSSSKEAINKGGTGNIFPWRDTWILQCWHHLAIFLELMIHSQR
jgi:hypothetical protein